MRALHLVKTADGAIFAALQVRELVNLGLEIHVGLPQIEGQALSVWRSSGAKLHVVDSDFTTRNPLGSARKIGDIRRLVGRINPDLIHSHFFQSAMTARLAMRGSKSPPRVFQVPGPLHLENAFFRHCDIASAGLDDFWLASSRYIESLYRNSGVATNKISLAYYGTDTENWSAKRTFKLRQSLGIRKHELMVGSISWMYPPKWYLGHRKGLKNHELIIESARYLLQARPDLHVVLVGGPWAGANSYFKRLKRLAAKVSPTRIHLPGPLPAGEARDAWPDFDCVIHVPTSENCGGVVEPLLAERTVVASAVGGIPEVVQHRRTGHLISNPRPQSLAHAILSALSDSQSEKYRLAGRKHAEALFDIKATSRAVVDFYTRILGT